MKEKRRKLLELHYDGVLDKDLFKEEQARLDKEERKARRRRAVAETNLADVIDNINIAMEMLVAWPNELPFTSDDLHSRYHEVFNETIEVDAEEGVVEAVPKRAERTVAITNAVDVLNQLDWNIGDPMPSDEAIKKTEPESAYAYSGSRMSLLVPRTGFEPVLPP